MLNRAQLLCVLFIAGCQSYEDTDIASSPDPLLRAGAWADYHMSRPDRSAREVVSRARAVGEIVLAEALPSSQLLDPTTMKQWAEAARKDRYREGALRFELNGHDLLVRYRPASARLTVSAFGAAFDAAKTPSDFGLEQAEARALHCLHRLEDADVIGSGEFSDQHNYVSTRPTFVEGRNTVSVGRYSFVYHPVLNGLPLLSSEVIIAVNAKSGACQRITVSGQVNVERLRDSEVAFSDEARAQRLVSEAVTAASPASTNQVHVYGTLGYYLPLTTSSGVVKPAYIANYTIEAGTPEQPILSRRKLVALPLAEPGEQELVDLLGPNW